jgi:valyl-tRNA synthetase
MAMEKNFDAGAAETAIYQAWEASGAFRAGANAREGAKSFCIMIPPPNVTGSLHMGHAFNNTLQDILIRWHRMRGFDTLWQPGQDHAGIATQMVVERKLAAEGNESRREMGREKFLEKVWEWKAESGGTIINQLKRLGASCDWERNAFTMSGAPGAPMGEEGNFHDAVLKVFVSLYNKGLIYKGKRLVNWDPHFETAISDLEVEQVEKDGHMWRLRYPLADGATYEHPVAFDEEGKPTEFETRDYLVVATTRPETMLGDTGVAVHPDDDRYKHLVGKDAILPLVGRRLKIVADDYADPEKGTGAVKMTPAHDFNDWAVGERTGLRAINVLNTRAGMFLKDNADFAEGCDAEGVARVIEALDGSDRYEARDWIIQIAEDEGWLDGIDSDRHMVPHGDRAKVAIEPYLTDQWFVDAAKLAGPAMEAVEKGETTILPKADEKVYFHWMKNIEPWCISRQLWWGHQVPVWYDEDGNAYCEATEEEAIAASGGKALTRDEDVLDTWFSSGLWAFGTLGWPENTPELEKYYTSPDAERVLITGFDIIFFWVARMMMMSIETMGKVPFETVYVHALVRDEHGKKMSKSLGNVLDPLELIDEYGADAVRFTLTAMAAMGRDLKLSTQRIQGYRNFGTKLWNAARFAEFNECSPVEGFDPKSVDQTLNKWIVGETARVREAVDDALNQYRFNDAANALYAFVWGKVCDWYVELSKPLFQGEDAAVKAETQATMSWVLDQCLILMHPIMPYITEQLWGDIAERPKMLVHADWPDYTVADYVDAAADREMSWVVGLIEQVRSVRAEMHVNAGAKIPMVLLGLDDTAKAALNGNLSMITRLARISEITEADEAPKGAVTLPVEGGSVCLPLAGVIDVAEEKARLQKVMDKLAKEVGGIKGKLSNAKFVDNAPQHVVDENRNRLESASEEMATLKAAYDRLSALEA